jgi:hypothetical protein
MKFHVAVAVIGAAVALVGTQTAKADVTISLDAPTITGNVYSYSGTIFHVAGTSDTLVDGDFFSLPDGVTVTDNFADPILGDLPINFSDDSSAGVFSYHGDSLFDLTVPAGTTPFPFTFGVTSGDTGVVASVTQVPEPGSIALLLGGVMGGGLFLARRRRK